jgi:methyltransferase (TIGR00027 family)
MSNADEDGMSEGVPFTARLIAHHRARESQRENPLIRDPYAEMLAGDLTGHLKGHSASRGDYSIVRAYYIENNILTAWCQKKRRSQIVLLGAGLDTRAYRFEPLSSGGHTLYEVDLPSIINYKTEVLKDESPLCKLIRVPADLEDDNWWRELISSGFSSTAPTLWILEGLIYYLPKHTSTSILTRAAEMCAEESEIFFDVCVPILAEVRFGAFMMHFKWGIEKYDTPEFLESTGWTVTCSYADEHDQGRNVGQRGFIFVKGQKARQAEIG